ncbi:ornithine decarboxylase [Actinocrispum wychmicini]|uniref:S-adenosylmethionine decarboxylase proenzyme n=1 Tax=Actinocrispum wychmicini TaxID=1213861 RepID=A0A4R2JAR7_9PSEU|nr:ornithine decarboxylase [Actinocrispum wychmicini]
MLPAVIDALPQAPERGRAFLDDRRPPTPCLVIDLDTVRESHTRLREALPEARLYYAVKANPAPEIVRQLARAGAGFDVAGREEIELCLDQGARPETISYGNTVKKARDVLFAFKVGVRRFTFDSAADLANLAEHAPGSTVSCRILVDSSGSRTPFGQKFGCVPDMAVELLVRAAELGLDPEGVAFHVGSQHLDPHAWDAGIAAAAEVTRAVAERGVLLRGLNIGGGLPGRYRDEPLPLSAYVSAIRESVGRHFAVPPDLAFEPGRALVADAGVIRSEVVLVSRKADTDERRWVYLDIGRYGGMAETENEAIAYRLATAHDGTPDGPAIIAGPTCDGDDVLYQRTPYRLPLALRAGDYVDILSTGAYTQSYSSVSFNGFPPLKTYFVGGEPDEVGEFAGRHVLAEFSGVSPKLLNDAAFLCESLERALDKAGATVCDMTFKQFEPQGVTVLALLSESHASIHSYPERGSVFVDVFTCGRRADPELAVQLLRDMLGASVAITNTIHRGQEDR